MKIVVLIKQVPDVNAIRIDKATGKPILSGQNVISSYDDAALEEALKLKDASGAEVVVVSAGPASVKDAIQRGLAMGADSAVHLEIDRPNDADTLSMAAAISGELRGMTFDLLLMGQASDDVSSGQMAAQIAELLGLPQVSSLSKIVGVEGNVVTVQRDTEDGRQTIEATMPVALLAVSGINVPRYPSLKGIMAAKKKPVEHRPLVVEAVSRMSWSEPFIQERKAAGVILQDVPAAAAAKQLVSWLKTNKLV